MKITVGIITLNEEANLGRCLSSVNGLADEILIVDSGSTDRTREIAESFGVRWESRSWQGFVQQKNEVLKLATHPWVLSLDADEALSPELRVELMALKSASVPSQRWGGYSMPRCVCYEGRWIRHGDWYPDRLVRLFQRSKARFVGGKVHERLEIEGEICRLHGELEHHSFSDASDHFARCQKYARLWAEDKWGLGKRCGRWTPHLHAAFRWIRGFVLRRGFLDGRLGLRIASYSAYEVYLKYSLLRSMGQPPESSGSSR